VPGGTERERDGKVERISQWKTVERENVKVENFQRKRNRERESE